MGYERYPRGTNPQDDYYNRSEAQDYGRDYGSGRDYSYSSARDYEAAGYYDRNRDDHRGGGDRSGSNEYGSRGYGREGGGRDRTSTYGYDRSGRQDQSYGGQQYGNQSRYARGDEYHGSYASDGRRFTETGQNDWDRGDRGGRDNHDYYERHEARGYGRQPQGNYGRQSQGDYGRQPQGYDYQDRGFFSRAGDEVRSWFGDDEAERRRELDGRYDERYYGQRQSNERDSDYHSWRSTQIAALDRDYDEYRNENRSRFENEFSSWRTNRQSQRDLLGKVKEHAEVVGSDGAHVGTVDKVRGDRILLTKNDADAGGRHHSFPSSWLQTVDEKKVTLSKTAEQAKQHWRTEEEKQALFGYGDQGSGNDRSSSGTNESSTNLNRSFSGTY